MKQTAQSSRVETHNYQLDQPSLQSLLQQHKYYVAYTYSYPHKTAYRPIPRAPSLAQLWSGEKKDALFLYVHVPFCESRCGYCNLFSHSCVDSELATLFVDTLERQLAHVSQALGSAQYARVAIGGGTPSQLPLQQLNRVLQLIQNGLGLDLDALPVSFETSPTTATDDKLALIAGNGIDRLSIGIQSFHDRELKSLGRNQPVDLCQQALDRIRRYPFRTLNIDLIYGIAGQTTDSWRESLLRALDWQPEELYLYPLYRRPLTGLGNSQQSWDDQRLELYRHGRQLLLNAGYQQVSMRMFRKTPADNGGAVYTCQEDGMVGLGCGARSYTKQLHYSDEWAVGAQGVRQILQQWTQRPDSAFQVAGYGYALDRQDQSIRYVLKSLLRTDGLDLNAYQQYFGSEVLDDLPQLTQTLELALIEQRDHHLVPTEKGLELSDCIGPWLYSQKVRARMGSFDLR